MTRLSPQTGEGLVEQSHYASDEIETRIMDLFQKWEELREATARSWKQCHTVLIGRLLNFYRDKRDVQSYLSACPPINVTHGLCEVAGDYVKRKHTLRLK